MAFGGDVIILVLIAIVAVIAFVVSAMPRRPKTFKDRPRKTWSEPPARVRDVRDAHDQLRIVASAPFEARKVMNAAEYRVFKIIEDEVRKVWPHYRVFSQTSLGELIRSTDARAHSCINSKRVDVVVISPTGLPAVVLEYQGGGHFQSSAAARDAVKREALRKAGVPYVEVLEKFSDQDVLTVLHREMRAWVGPDTRVPS
jgi:hypothetical protein